MLVKYIGLSGGFNLVLILFEKQFRWWVAKALLPPVASNLQPPFPGLRVIRFTGV